MAKKNLTLEDMLVPVDEIPYAVPENWCWVRFEHLVKDTKLGLVRSVKQQSIDYEYNYLKMNNITNSGEIDLNGIVNVNADRDEIEVYSLKKGDFLFNTRNSKELVGKNTVVKEDFQDIMLFNNNIMRVRFHEGINPQIVSNYLNSPMGQRKLDEIKRVTTNIAAIYAKDLNKILIPIPPLAEQERIVNRIESLFEKVDRAAELVDEARDGFEKRRAAILEMAFSGQLTKKWREENSVSDEWDKVKLSDVCDIIMGQSPKGSSYNDIGEGIPLVNGPVEFGPTHFSKTVKSKWTTQPTKMCKELDLLLCVRGSTLGRINIAGFEACIGRGVAAIRAKDGIEQKYINYIIHSMRSEIYNIGTGTTFPNISSQQIKDIEIGIPSLDEQIALVSILDRLLDSEYSIEEVSDISENIEVIKKSIIAKAFRGELGSNNLDEESSIDLLKELIK